MKSLKAIAHNLRIEGHSVWLCARDPLVPLPARLFGLAVAGYALSPIDLIPDFIPVLGLLDDALLIPLGVWLFLKMDGRRSDCAPMVARRALARLIAVVDALLVARRGLIMLGDPVFHHWRHMIAPLAAIEDPVMTSA
jgi:uncharacterized membrane protein YkvA (DUF1232 family)